MKGKLLSIAALFILFVSCSKLNSRKHYKLDDNFRSFFNYNNGSIWNFVQENDTNYHEKVEVLAHLEGKMVWDGFDQEFFEYKLISDKDSEILFRAIADENDVGRAVILRKDTGYRHAAEWFYGQGQFSVVSGTGDSLIVHNSYTVLGKSYTDVIELVPKTSAYYRRILIAKKVGIIRKVMKNGKAYVLKSYSVL